MTPGRCIRHTHTQKLDETWCGRRPGGWEWLFVSVDHAVYSVDGSVPFCQDCLAAIVGELVKNWQPLPDPPVEGDK